MADINFRSLISTESGVGATTGRETAKFFNENFRITKENLEAIWGVLQDMVGSKNIEGIRVVPYYNPDDAEELLGYYLEFTDNPDLTVEEDYMPVSLRWQDIIGSPYMNTVLAQILSDKVDIDVFQSVSDQVDINTAAIDNNNNRLLTLEESQARQDLDILDLQETTKDLREDVDFKVDLYRGDVQIYSGNNGTDYRFGDVIDSYPSGSGQYIMITGVDENGSVIQGSYLPNISETSQGHILIDTSGNGYSINDIIPVVSYAIINSGSGYHVNDIIRSSNGHFYKVINVSGAGELVNILPTQIQAINTSGSGAAINDDNFSTSMYAQVTEIGPNGEIVNAIVAEGDNIDVHDDPTGTGALLFYTYGTGAQLTFQGFNTLMFRYNTVEPISAGDPPKGIIYSIADGAPGTWKSMTENIPFANLINIKQRVNYVYNTLTITNPDSGEILPYAYGYSVGDKVNLVGINGLEVEITEVDDNGTPLSFTPENFNSPEVLSGIYSTNVISNNWFNSVIISSPGLGYEVGDEFTLDNLENSPTFTVTSVGGSGEILTVTPSSFSTTSNIGGSYYAHEIAGRTAAVIYISASSGNAAFGLRFKVDSTPKTTNVEFNNYIDDLVRALKGSWNSDIEAYNYVLNRRIDSKAEQESLDLHTGDFSNPHNVSKEQVGLDAVDNTSDMDKPISTAALDRFQSIEAAMTYIPRCLAISKEGYNNLNSNYLLDSSTFYFVSRNNPPYSIAFTLFDGGHGYSINDTFALVGSYNPEFEGKVTGVDENGSVTDFIITNLVSQVDFDISGLYSTSTLGYGTGLLIVINCEIID